MTTYIEYVASGCVLAVALLRDAQGELHGAEKDLARGMSHRRAQEFRGGRTVARTALSALGERQTAILWGAGGEPTWNPGIVGSLSHIREAVGALVAQRSLCRAVGLDLDDRRSISAVAAAELMTGSEIELALRTGLVGDEAQARTLIFSVKEAFYKCQYPLTLCSDLAFDEVDLAPSRGPGSLFEVVLKRELPGASEWLRRIRISSLLIQGFSVNLAILPS